jgi:transcriptional regulator with XRE-family HTH domain
VSFGEELRKIRESRGMTVNQLGMYSGISGASISRYETGERGTPKPPTIKKLAEALKYPYEELMRLAGYIEDNPDIPKEYRESYKEIISLIPQEVAEEFSDLPEEKREEIIEHLIFNIKNSLRKMDKKNKQ